MMLYLTYFAINSKAASWMVCISRYQCLLFAVFASHRLFYCLNFITVPYSCLFGGLLCSSFTHFVSISSFLSFIFRFFVTEQTSVSWQQDTFDRGWRAWDSWSFRLAWLTFSGRYLSFQTFLDLFVCLCTDVRPSIVSIEMWWIYSQGTFQKFHPFSCFPHERFSQFNCSSYYLKTCLWKWNHMCVLCVLPAVHNARQVCLFLLLAAAGGFQSHWLFICHLESFSMIPRTRS